METNLSKCPYMEITHWLIVTSEPHNETLSLLCPYMEIPDFQSHVVYDVSHLHIWEKFILMGKFNSLIKKGHIGRSLSLLCPYMEIPDCQSHVVYDVSLFGPFCPWHQLWWCQCDVSHLHIWEKFIFCIFPFKSMEKINSQIYLLAKYKHAIPDEAGRFDIWLECVAQKLWEE